MKRIAACLVGFVLLAIAATAWAQRTDMIYSGTSPLVYKFARINCSADDCPVVDAVATMKIRVIAAAWNVSGDTTMHWETGATDTFLSGPWNLGGAGEARGAVLPFAHSGHFETAAGAALTIDGAAVTTGGHVVYIELQ